MIADRYDTNTIRASYLAYDHARQSLETFRRDIIRSQRASVDADTGVIEDAHHPILELFVYSLLDQFGRLEDAILDACRGSRDIGTDEPYWEIRTWGIHRFTSVEADGSRFEDEESSPSESYYFRSLVEAEEFRKYLAILEDMDYSLQADDPRFESNGW